MNTSIISHGYSPPVFYSTKHALNLVAFPVEYFVVIDRFFTTFPGRDAGSAYLAEQGIAQPVRIISPIGKQIFGLWQMVQQQGNFLMVVCLSGSQHHGYGFALFDANCVQFGIDPFFCAPDATG